MKVYFVNYLLAVFMASLTAGFASAQSFDVPDDFRVEQLYEVPREQGSWVSMTFDPHGRIITSHEGGGLFESLHRRSANRNK